ncbi:hypothetical protein [Paraburkholderia sp. DGU8]|uniref:hypothetical protein n=1 Tax=Paraburkholderia sp. DGU8 TaxID=3161997 RepID=UPI003467A372
MNKRPTSRKFVRDSALKGKIDELNSAVRVIKALKNEPDRVVRVKTMVSRDGVIVKVVPKLAKDLTHMKVKTALPRSGNFKVHTYTFAIKSTVSKRVDRSIEDTDRAVRTLSTGPSEQVAAFYKKLAAKRAV